MIFKKENRVKLVTFLRTLKSNKVVDDIDNYWKLIGENATIIDVGTNDYFNGKVLLLFDKDLDIFKVANHNPIKNSLWINIYDLELIE